LVLHLGRIWIYPFRIRPDLFVADRLLSQGFVWSWIDDHTGKIHKNLIEPHPDHMKTMLRNHFNVIKVIEYPDKWLHSGKYYDHYNLSQN